VLYSHTTQLWKIADFGFTTEGSTYKQESKYSRGTEGYRAPELLKSASFNNATDIWALGCILFELATRRKAFPTDWAVFQFIHENKSFRLDNKLVRTSYITYTEELSEHLQNMLQADPTLRPSAAVISVKYQQLCASIPPVRYFIKPELPAGRPSTTTRNMKKYSITDFIIFRVVGRGELGLVHLVQSRHNNRFYTMKVTLFFPALITV